MKKAITMCLIGTQIILTATGQSTKPYKVNASVEFESPKGHKVLDPIPYGNDGIIQVNGKGAKSFSFQHFSNDLKLQKENVAKSEDKLNDDVNYQRIIKFKNKTYLFVREVFKETKTEGITALEFSPKDLDFLGMGKNLYKSSGKVQSGWHGFVISDDKTKFACYYSLTPKEKRDKLNKEIIGIQVFDENLVNQWGGEFEMPYTEAKMDNLGYTLSGDSKIYLLTKVFDGETRKESIDGKPNYHYEVFVYQKGSEKPKVIEIQLDSYFPQSTYIYEEPNHNIVLAGFYSKGAKTKVDGAYMVRLDVEKGVATKVSGGYYEIPSEVLKSFESDRQKRKLDKKENSGADLGISYLQIRKIYTTADGSTKIISEQYHVVTSTHYNGKTTTTTYDTYAEDIFVMSIDSKGKLEWVKKIPKNQHSNDALGAQLSLNMYISGNDVHLFYIDNLKNYNLPETQAPYRHENRRGGFLTGVTINAKGDVKKYNLGEIDKFETNFFIRDFVDGERNNLISTERRKKMNMLFSIDIK